MNQGDRLFVLRHKLLCKLMISAMKADEFWTLCWLTICFSLYSNSVCLAPEFSWPSSLFNNFSSAFSMLVNKRITLLSADENLLCGLLSVLPLVI